MRLTVEMRTRNAIVIEWKKPETSLYPLDHYEVHWGRNGYVTEIKMVKQTFAVIRNLQSDTSYTIKVRAANRRFCRSEFSEISVKTKSVMYTLVDVLVDGALVGMHVRNTLIAAILVTRKKKSLQFESIKH